MGKRAKYTCIHYRTRVYICYYSHTMKNNNLMGTTFRTIIIIMYTYDLIEDNLYFI